MGLWRAFCVALAALILLVSPAIAKAKAVSALAPVDVALDGQRELVGVAVASDGTVYASDRKAGSVLKLAPSGHLTLAAAGLKRPKGLAVDEGGRLVIAEEGAGRVLRLEPTGTLSVLAVGIHKPRWLAIAPDGAVYVAAKGPARAPRDDEDEEDDDRDDARDDHDVILRRDPVTGALAVVATHLRKLQGLALNGTALYAAAKRVDVLAKADGVIVRYPLRPDGSLGAPSYFIAGGLDKPTGLVLDRLGALYVGSKKLETATAKVTRAIGKVHADAHLTAFAHELEDPQGLALGPDGALWVADGDGGRLLRFRAPPAPTFTGLPEFTNQSPLTVGGTTERGARVDLFVNEATTGLTTTATSAGFFTLSVPLALNAANTLEAFATAHGGTGLTGVPAQATVTHDDIAPGLVFLAPPPLAHVRQSVSVAATASDAGSGVAGVTLSAAGQPLATALSPLPPAAAVTASALWDTRTIADGAVGLTATATDRAQNTTTITRGVIVDNTPPDTEIVSGPSGGIAERTATFTFTGTDNLTPQASLMFAWRLDGAPFTAFAPTTSATFRDLAPGDHTFEVRARDLAGNEDPSPAVRRFAVVQLSIQITSPADGAALSTDRVLVRGTVFGGADVGVTVNGLPAQASGNAFAALVPLTTGPNILTAAATDPTGRTASHVVTVTVLATPEPPVMLTASPTAGLAPLSVAFSLTSQAAVTRVELDLEGDGTVEFTGAGLDGQTFTYTRPGLYIPTVAVTDAQGQRQTASAIVQVYDRAMLDALFQARWTALKDALRRGDVTAALGSIASIARDRYRDFFTALTPQLAQIDQILTTVSLVSVDDGRVEYQMIRVDDGVRLSYFVLFVTDLDGIWRLTFF